MNQIGKYRFSVTSQGFGQSKNGTPFFFLEGTPASLIGDDGVEYECEHYARTIKLYINEKTIDARRKELAALGFTGKFGQLDPAQANHHSFVGTDIEVVCKHEPGIGDSAGKTFEKWELPFESTPREATVSTPGIASKLDALFGKKAGPAAKPAAKAPAKPPVRQPVSQGVGGPDDETPF